MALPPPRQRISSPIDVTIANAASLSAAIPLRGRLLVGVYIPASWTTAAMTFTASQTEAGTYVDLFGTGGSELSISAASSLYLAIDPVNFYGINFLKVRSGTTGTPVNQVGAITVQLMLRALVRD